MSKDAYVLTGGEAMGEFKVIDRNRSPEFIPPRDHVAHVLETTADRFESGELNWYQGDFEAVDPLDGHVVGHCAIGGLCKVAGEDWGRTNKPVVAAAVKAMRPHIAHQVEDHLKREAPHDNWDASIYPAENLVITFNDQLARDVSEVVEVMKQAAKDLRNQS